MDVASLHYTRTDEPFPYEYSYMGDVLARQGINYTCTNGMSNNWNRKSKLWNNKNK